MTDVANTLSSHAVNFKFVTDKQKSLIPENAVLLKTCPELEAVKSVGRGFRVPVMLQREQGFTYGDGGATDLLGALSGVYEEIEVDSRPCILSSVISQEAVDRMGDKEYFLGEGMLRTIGMSDAMTGRAEISLLYGQSGLGTTASSVNIGATSTTVTFTEASWSDGIWSQAAGARANFYNGATLVSSGADAIFSVTSYDPDLFKAVFTGTATGITALDSGIASGARTVYWEGSKTNDMLGLHGQMVGGASYFGIDPVAFPLWQCPSYSAQNASLTPVKIINAAARPVARGGLQSELECHVAAVTFANLQANEMSARSYDSGYSPKKAENGSEELCYRGANGKIKVVLNNVVKRGFSYLLPVKHLRRIGSSDIGWVNFGGKDQYFKFMETKDAWMLRMRYSFAILLDAPAKACLITNIVNN